MTIFLNEEGLHLLLDAADGPVAAEINRRAERVTELAQQNARQIMHRNPAVADAIGFALDADLTATIGIEDQGKQSRYLAQKEKREPGAWLLSALEVGFKS